jgi:ligand-binding sensor domain-containing protein
MVGKTKNSLLLFILLLSAESFLFSQNFRFKPYGAESGLSNKYINNINQGDDGYLWLGSGEGVFRFDGFRFINKFPGDTISQRIVTSNFKDSKSRLWFGYRDGAIAVLEGIRFRVILTDEVHKSSINGIVETKDGLIIAATQDKGLIIVNEDFAIKYVSEGLEGQLISTISLTSTGEIITGTFDGLFLSRFSQDKSKLESVGRFKDIPYTRVQTIENSGKDGKFWIGTETDGVYLLQKGEEDLLSYKTSKIGIDFGLKFSNIMNIYEDKEKNVWVCTNGEGVFRLLPGINDTTFSGAQHFGVENGLPSNYVSDVFEDFEGNLWFSTIGECITVLKDQSFSFYSFESEKFNDNILSICDDGNRYYLGGETGILVTDKNGNKAEYLIDRNNGLPLDKITALYKDKLNTIWIGTSHSGLYRLKAGSRRVELFAFSQNSLENVINAITGDAKNIWIATNGGVSNYNVEAGTHTRYTTMEGLPHNKIRDIFIDSKGNVCIALRVKRRDCELKHAQNLNLFPLLKIKKAKYGELPMVTEYFILQRIRLNITPLQMVCFPTTAIAFQPTERAIPGWGTAVD